MKNRAKKEPGQHGHGFGAKKIGQHGVVAKKEPWQHGSGATTKKSWGKKIGQHGAGAKK